MGLSECHRQERRLQMKNNDSGALFCANMLQLRQRLGLSKKEMAACLKISLYSLNRLEAGEIPPRVTVELLWELWDRFGVSPGAMLERELSFE